MKKDSEFKLGFIGMRTIKTVIAVYICFLYGKLRGQAPIYAALSALISMQGDHRDGMDVGKNRILGTIIGGLFGLISIVLVRKLNISPEGHIHYLLLSLFLIPVIYTNIYFFTPTSTTISCVVFLAIAASHASDMSALALTVNRTVDTIVGVVISVLINKFL